MITNENLVVERSHTGGLGGVQRIYRFKGGFGLSLVNSPMLHTYQFAWEAAVIKDVKDDGDFSSLVYDTALTDDVVVFDTDEEANTFIEKAHKYFEERS